jgi:hypothetical protein
VSDGPDHPTEDTDVVAPGALPEGAFAWVIRPGVLRRWRVLTVLAVVVMLAQAAAIGAMLPRVTAYDGLIDENLLLRGKVQELDRRMTEIDRILMRLRIYDVQMRGLGEVPEGEHGPLGDIDEPPPGDDEPFYEVDVPGGSVAGQELRPVGAWADAVVARADSFLSVFERVEPGFNSLVEELEGLRALEEALPSLWPTSGTLTSAFGYRRSPFGRRAQFHRGIDVSNDRGTLIVAAAPGRVVRAFYNGGYGRFVEIDHGYGITTRYAHMHRISVEEGQSVQRGDVVGTMGRTGRVTGTHLHFEVRIDGHAVDPLDYLPR